VADRKPTVLFILNDHQANYRHGWYGVKPARPHFDCLAREGVNFDRAYTVCPLCRY
jgi:arylsulfatase A-like enzyme